MTKIPITMSQFADSLAEMTLSQLNDESLKGMQESLKKSGVILDLNDNQKLEILIINMFSVTNAVSQTIQNEDTKRAMLDLFHKKVYDNVFKIDAEKYIFEKRLATKYNDYYGSLAIEDGSQAMIKLGKSMATNITGSDTIGSDAIFIMVITSYFVSFLSTTKDYIKEVSDKFEVS